jgi:C-terminal processing protease CtpA/Prc
VLEQFLAPLGPGIEIATKLPPSPATGLAKQPLVAWRYSGPGFSATGGQYRAKRTHRAPASDAPVLLMQTMPAGAWRGKPIRLRAQARAAASDTSASAALALNVDRSVRMEELIDKTADKELRDPEWRVRTVEGLVADDAEKVSLGLFARGAVTVDLDAVELAVQLTAGEWTEVPIQDGGFEAADTEPSAWRLDGPKNVISRPAEGAPEGRHYLRFAPPGAAAVDDELFPEGAPSPGAHADLDLGSGLRARVALALTDAEARPDPARKAGLDALRAALAAVAGPSDTPDLDQRLADVVVAWSVFRHFYPYWSEVGVDWDSRLRPHLEAARGAEGRAAQRDAIRGLVADARDGHGSVTDPREASELAALPLSLTVVEGRLVVTSSRMPSEAPVGAVVTTIDGVPAEERLARAIALTSGTKQWREVRAMLQLMLGKKGATVKLGLDSGQGLHDVTLTFGAPPPPVKRPAPVTQIEPGLWYVDLTRAKMAEVFPKLDALATARGVVFDVRGYPGDAGARLLPYLLDAPETDRWMHVAKIVGPFYDLAGWLDLGWDLKPASPRIAGKVVFLTDGSAISYAESVMGYVADRKLGTIVGSTTAGANGNVASFVTPGGFNVSFTGMRVTRHDGTSPHHLVGVAPDVPVAPTVGGLRAGRDEVLERGLAIAGAGAMASAPTAGSGSAPHER